MSGHRVPSLGVLGKWYSRAVKLTWDSGSDPDFRAPPRSNPVQGTVAMEAWAGEAAMARGLEAMRNLGEGVQVCCSSLGAASESQACCQQPW